MSPISRDEATDSSPTGAGIRYREAYMYEIGQVVGPQSVTQRGNNLTPASLEEEAAYDRSMGRGTVGTRGD